MNTETWNPGHGLNKGYPFAGIESEKQLPNRIKIILEENNIITVDFASFGEPLNDSQEQLDFMISRAFDFQEALRTAEQQIKELLSEDPFIPEDLGFELLMIPATADSPPIRTYVSKYDGRFILYREIGDLNDINWDTSKWILMKKHEDGSGKFDKIPVRIPNYRIAYALFSAVGLIMEPEQHEANEAPVVEEKPEDLTEHTLDAMLTEKYGPKGTPERDAYDVKIHERVKTLGADNLAKEEGNVPWSNEEEKQEWLKNNNPDHPDYIKPALCENCATPEICSKHGCPGGASQG